MAVETLGPVLLLCIAAFLFAPIGSASAEGRTIRRPPMTQPIDPRQHSNVSYPLNQAPPPNPSSTLPDISPTSCQTYNCNLFYQYASVFYFGTGSQNTACLTSPQPTTIPIDLHMVFPSVYVIFPSIMASDGCQQIGKGYGPITTSFAPGELSTIAPGGLVTNVFNFDDLPCPPSGVHIPPGDTYAPLIAPPAFFWELDPAFSTCIPSYAQGVVAPVDPPGGHTPVHQTSEVPDLSELPPRRRDLGVSGWGPTKTAGPTLRAQL